MNRTVVARGFDESVLTLERDEESNVTSEESAESFSGLLYFESKSRVVIAASGERGRVRETADVATVEGDATAENR